MSVNVTTALVNQFSSNVRLLAQQQGSRLRMAVLGETLRGEYGYFDQIGAAEATLRTSRHQATSRVDVPHSRRQVTGLTYDWSDMIDQPDRVKMLADLNGPYTRSAVNALGRQMDRDILAALRGTAKTGKAGATSTTLPSGQKVAVGSTGLTKAKILAAREILLGNDVDPAAEPWFGAITSDQLTDLLNVTEVASSDYNTVKALVSGDVDTWLGIKWIHTELVPNLTTTRYVMVWARDGALLAVNDDIKVRIDELPTYNYSTQVWASATFGATRMDEDKVVEISCLES